MLTPTHLTTLRALAVPGDLWPDVLADDYRCGPIEGPNPLRRMVDNVPARTVDAFEKIDEQGRAWSFGGHIWDVPTLTLPLTHRLARAHVAHLMAAGLRCPTCADHVGLRLACPTCLGTGWIRRPASAWHLLPADECNGGLPPELAAHAPALLACHVARVAAGGVGVREVLPAWEAFTHYGYTAARGPGWPPLVGLRAHGWIVHCGGREADGSDRPKGPETGPAGMAAADAAALAAGFALVTPDGGVTLPWPTVDVQNTI